MEGHDYSSVAQRLDGRREVVNSIPQNPPPPKKKKYFGGHQQSLQTEDQKGLVLYQERAADRGLGLLQSWWGSVLS